MAADRGKSFRGGQDAELIRREAPFAALEAVTVADNGKENQIRLTVGAAAASAPAGMRCGTAPPPSGPQPGGELPGGGL